MSQYTRLSTGTEIVIGDVSIVQGGNTAVVDVTGALKVTGDSVVSGTVDANIKGLNTFQTSQYTVGTSAVQLTPTPLANRSSMIVKVVTTNSSVAVFIGNSSGVTTSTGFPLFNGDAIELDLTGADPIYAISGTAGQSVYVLELG